MGGVIERAISYPYVEGYKTTEVTMSDSEAMSDEDFEKADPDDDFSLRRMAALGDETEDNEDGETETKTKGKEYTDIELAAEREDLLGRKVYTEDSIEEFIAALRDGAEYYAAAESYLKMKTDEDESEKPDSEYPVMMKELAEREKGSDEEFPLMARELSKKKKIVSPEDWKPIDDYPSMEEEFGKE